MTDKTFIMNLAKLLIAGAWADGELAIEEINALKDLLFSLPDISGEEWKQLEIYMDSPVTLDERKALISKVLTDVTTQEDKALVLETLSRLFQADGMVSDEESAMLQEIKLALEKVHTGIFSRMSRMIKASIKRRNETSKSGIQREGRIDDFIMNTVYYQLETELLEKGIKINLPEQQLRKLCFASGLLARIAAVDSGISEKERNVIQSILTEKWNLSREEARLVAEIGCRRALKGLDYYRTTRGFFDCTNHDERKDFLACLFEIANASEMTSHKEIEEIRRISGSLKLSHRDFIDAKLTIPREDREVL